MFSGRSQVTYFITCFVVKKIKKRLFFMLQNVTYFIIFKLWKIKKFLKKQKKILKTQLLILLGCNAFAYARAF